MKKHGSNIFRASELLSLVHHIGLTVHSSQLKAGGYENVRPTSSRSFLYGSTSWFHKYSRPTIRISRLPPSLLPVFSPLMKTTAAHRHRYYPSLSLPSSASAESLEAYNIDDKRSTVLFAKIYAAYKCHKKRQ